MLNEIKTDLMNQFSISISFICIKYHIVYSIISSVLSDYDISYDNGKCLNHPRDVE